MSNTPVLKIRNREISVHNPPYIIAELSANHNGSLQTAIELVKKAKWAGVDAVKLQTYRADTITLPSGKEDFQIKSGLWSGRTLFELYEDAHMPWDWHKPIFEYCRQLDLTVFSSPFDTSAVDFLEDLNAPAYKIASFEAIDLPLIRYAASTQKPLIISTGMADIEEIQEALDAAASVGNNNVALLHCVSGYPASPNEYNLNTIVDMSARFDTVVGLSDHTLSNITAFCSVALGASIIEKHFTLDRSGGGPDDSFSLEPNELKNLCEGSAISWQALGNAGYSCQESEKGNVKFRRSIYTTKNLKAGDIIRVSDIAIVRPGYGLKPKFYDMIVGKKVIRDIDQYSAVTWDLLSRE